jgi:diguanylate cyclase (GGDEF)-like protein/PAS domain S-box-containing protein
MAKSTLHYAVIKASIILIGWFIVLAALHSFFSKELTQYPKLINIAGKQRMLSQKAAFIATSNLPSILQRYEFSAVEKELLKSNELLLNNLNTRALRHYFKEQNLTPRLEQYLGNLSDFLEQTPLVEQAPALTKNLDDMFIESQEVLDTLDYAVTLFEEASERAATHLLVFRLTSVISIILLLAILYFTMLSGALRRNENDALLKDKTILRFKNLFDHSSEGLVIMNKAWHIEHTNQAAKKILQYTNDTVTVEDFWQQTLNKELKAEIEVAIDQEGKWEGQLSPSDKQQFYYLSIFEIRSDQSQENFYGATIRDITEIKQKESDLETLALFDELTGLANRPHIINELQLACESESQEAFALMFLDLDGFKQINDGYGHEIGDEFLVEVAFRLKTLIKKSDIVARLGGDEFVIVAKNIKERQCLVHLAQRILSAFERPVQCSDFTIAVSLSIGISLYPDDASSPNDLLKKADLAMYSSKQQGKNRFYFFNQEMALFLSERFSFEEDIRYGIANDEFYQVFQPVINARTNKVVGCEVLLRWNNKRRGTVSPDTFIPLCESLNLMPHIDEIVFEKSIHAIEALPTDFYFSINLSAVHLSNTQMLKAFLQRLNDIKQKRRIIFELTETCIIKDLTRSIKTLNLIKQNGFSVAIDDFGTGYTSLQNFKSLEFDIIKIDRVFIADLLSNNTSKSIVKAMVKLATDMNMQVIAEGAEDAATCKYLASLGCHYIQGYYYSRPLSFEDLQIFIQSSQVT